MLLVLPQNLYWSTCGFSPFSNTIPLFPRSVNVFVPYPFFGDVIVVAVIYFFSKKFLHLPQYTPDKNHVFFSCLFPRFFVTVGFAGHHIGLLHETCCFIFFRNPLSHPPLVLLLPQPLASPFLSFSWYDWAELFVIPILPKT